MTIEKRVTIQIGDIIAFEVECNTCHTRTIRPLTDEIEVPVKCGNPGCASSLWFAPGSNEYQNLKLLLQLLADFRTPAAGKPHTMKLEIIGLGEES